MPLDPMMSADQIAQMLAQFIQIGGDVQLMADTFRKSGTPAAQIERAFGILRQMPGLKEGLSAEAKLKVMSGETEERLKRASGLSDIKLKEQAAIRAMERALPPGVEEHFRREARILLNMENNPKTRLSDASFKASRDALTTLGAGVPSAQRVIANLDTTRARNTENLIQKTSESLQKTHGDLPTDVTNSIRTAVEQRGVITPADRAGLVQKIEVSRLQDRVVAAQGQQAKETILGALTGGNLRTAEAGKFTLAKNLAAAGKGSEMEIALKEAAALGSKAASRGKLAGAGGVGLGLALLLPLLFGKKEEPSMLPLAQMQLLQTLGGLQNQQALTQSTVGQRDAEAQLAGAKAMLLRLQAMQAMSGGGGGGFI